MRASDHSTDMCESIFRNIKLCRKIQKLYDITKPWLEKVGLCDKKENVPILNTLSQGESTPPGPL